MRILLNVHISRVPLNSSFIKMQFFYTGYDGVFDALTKSACIAVVTQCKDDSELRAVFGYTISLFCYITILI